MFERDYLVTGYFSGPLFIGRIRVCLSKPVLVHNYIMMVACRRRWQRPNYCGSCQGDVRDRSFSYSRMYSGGMFHKLWFIVWNIIIILCIKTCFRFAPMLIFYVIGTHYVSRIVFCIYVWKAYWCEWGYIVWVLMYYVRHLTELQGTITRLQWTYEVYTF